MCLHVWDELLSKVMLLHSSFRAVFLFLVWDVQTQQEQARLGGSRGSQALQTWNPDHELPCLPFHPDLILLAAPLQTVKPKATQHAAELPRAAFRMKHSVNLCLEQGGKTVRRAGAGERRASCTAQPGGSSFTPSVTPGVAVQQLPFHHSPCITL